MTEIKVTTLEDANKRINEAFIVDDYMSPVQSALLTELIAAYKHIDNQRKRIKYLEGLMWPGGEVVE